ncbi:MAG: peptidase domain-containing ABC transporter, partial [Sphingomicrobium sp.]
LACLAMVAGHHGLNTDLPTLRRRFAISLKGTTLKGLTGIAEQIGFNTRALRGEIGDLAQLQLPAILHWDLNHFVVLSRVRTTLKGRRFEILDPARGKRLIGEAELSRHFTGVVLELTKSESFQRRTERSQLKIGQLWSRMSGLGGALRNILVLSVILQLAALALPFYLQLAIDTVFPSFDTDLLTMLALGFGGLALINLMTGWLRSLILVSLGQSLAYQVVVNLYRHLMRLPLPWFEKRHVGDIISRFGSTQPISDILAQGLIAAVIDGVMGVLTLGLMFLYSPKLAGIAFVAWLLFAALKIGSFHAIRMQNVDVITAAARENSSFIESVRGIAAIKAFGQEGNRQRQWQQLKADAVNANIRLGRLTSGFDAMGQFVLAVEKVLFIYLAISMAMEGAFTVGMIFAFQAYKQHFLDASTRLVDFGIRYKLLDVHLNRIADIALSPPELPAEAVSSDIGTIRGAIELRNVGFRYGAGEPEVLRGVSLRIEPGEFVTLVGPSGGGKTTLLKIMMGLVPPSYGQLLIDAKPLGSAVLPHWRRRIGSVAQDDMLYAGSLAENIAFFDPEIDMERVIEVARLAAIHDDIEAMPMRYETLVGDMGSALSGGQKQRILLARALYPDPAVLFIDEGTAHLDSDSERLVMEAIGELPITRIISAHRPGAAAAAGRTLLVAHGQVRPFQPKMVDAA